jgi:hypothetical protein
VKVERFDDLQPGSKPDFVKIEVQGHELATLSGIERALAANGKVRVLFEFAPAALGDAGIRRLYCWNSFVSAALKFTKQKARA